MGRISSMMVGFEMTLLNQLDRARADEALTLLRMSEEKEVVAPWVDPGRFRTISKFQSDLTAVRSTMKNAAAAQTMFNSAQTNVASIKSELEKIQDELEKEQDGTITNQTERDAAQAVIDEAIAQIQSLATESIEGKKLFDGSAEFQVYGRNPAQVDDIEVTKVGGMGQSTAAMPATLTYTGSDRFVTDDATIRIADTEGGAGVILSVTQGDTLEEVAEAINDQATSTGISANVVDHSLRIQNTAKGAEDGVKVEVYDGTFAVGGGTHTVEQEEPAELFLQENDGKLMVDVEIDITGPDGSITFQNPDGAGLEFSLTDLADEVNANTHLTGVMAETSINDDETAGLDNVIRFYTVEEGESAQLTVLAYEKADPLNDYDLTDSDGVVTDTADGTQVDVYSATGQDRVLAENAVSGYVDTAATQAEAYFYGSGGVTDAARDLTLDLTGNAGTEQLTLASGTSLDDAVTAINNLSNLTGIQASRDGDKLTLNSVHYGEDATVQVTGEYDDLSALDTYRTDADGITYGTDAVASINNLEYRSDAAAEYRLRVATAGTTITGKYEITGPDGSYTIDMNDSLEETARLISQQSGTTGIVAYADENDLVLRSIERGSENTISIEELRQGNATPVGSFTEGTAGMLYHTLIDADANGKFDTNVSFDITGPTGVTESVAWAGGTSFTDAVTDFNTNYANTMVEAAYDPDNNRLTFTSVYDGSEATMEITNTVDFAVSGGNGDGTAQGTDGTGSESGSDQAAHQADGNAISYYGNQLNFTMTLHDGSTGELDAMTANSAGGLTYALSTDLSRTSAIALPDLKPDSLGSEQLGFLDDLASGGSLAGLGDNAAAALLVVEKAMNQTATAEAKVEGYLSSSIDSATTLLAETEQNLLDSIETVDGYSEEKEISNLSYYQSLVDNNLAALSSLYSMRTNLISLVKQAAGISSYY